MLSAEPVARYPSAGSTTSDPGVRPPLHASHVVRSTLRPGSAAFVPAAAAHLSSGGCPAAEVNTTASDPDAAAPTQYPHVMGYTRTHYNAGTSPQNGTHAISSPGGMSARARSFQLGSVVIDESLGLLVADGGVPAFEPSGTGVEAMRQVPVAARCGPSYDPRDSGHQVWIPPNESLVSVAWNAKARFIMRRACCDVSLGCLRPGSKPCFLLHVFRLSNLQAQGSISSAVQLVFTGTCSVRMLLPDFRPASFVQGDSYLQQ